MDSSYAIPIICGLFILLFYILMYGFIKPLREMKRLRSNGSVISEIIQHYNACEKEVSLLNFDSFKNLDSSKIVKSIEIKKEGNNLHVIFIEYKFTLPIGRSLPKSDISTYAFYLLKTENFNISIFPEELDTKEISEDSVLIRFDRVPVNFKKTKAEIDLLINIIINSQ